MRLWLAKLAVLLGVGYLILAWLAWPVGCPRWLWDWLVERERRRRV